MKYQIFSSVHSIFRPLPLWAALLLPFIISCELKNESVGTQIKPSTGLIKEKSDIRHAVGFDLLSHGKYKILHLFRHYNESRDTLSYVLYEEGAKTDIKFDAYIPIKVPLQRIALLHSSYISFFDLCDAIDHIKAISEAKYIYHRKVYQAVEAGELPEVGYGESLDRERLLALNIGAVITVGFPNAPNKSQHVLEELGIPVLILSDWQETTLLGRAEWVKVVAALTGKEALASEKFRQIEKEYNRLVQLTSNLEVRPRIICNLPYKGAWYVPGGNSYMSKLFHDAGGDYLWSDSPGTGGIQVDFEEVYAKGQLADFWINPDFAQDIRDILGKDERLGDFLPIKKGEVFNSNKRVARDTANDYWESGLIRPEVILADLIRILHPDVLPGHDLFYFRKLK